MSLNKPLKVAGKPSPGRRRSVLTRRRSAGGFASPSRDDQRFNEEVHKIEQLVLDLCAQLDRSEKKLATHIRKIDQNLAELAVQREEIRILERGLGIERQG